nr:isocitrate lyase/phosphoenolpyruvate mutase family protein [uncultured Sulfitobacter sp.]
MPTQQEKFARFKALHEQDGAFVMPNPWDAGSARILTAAGFHALATTSAGYAFSVGKRDSFAGLSRDEILSNAAAIVAATDLPVSADLEDGFGHDSATCADTVSKACDIGLVGGSIEDATGDPDQPILEMSLAVARIAAAAQALKAQTFFAYGARGKLHLWASRLKRYDQTLTGLCAGRR